jgi:hypothetical protein
LACDGEALVHGAKKPEKLKIAEIEKTSKATSAEDEFGVLVDLASLTSAENIQMIEFSVGSAKKSFSVDLRLLPEFDPESGALLRLRTHAGLVKAASYKTALKKRMTVTIGTLKNTYETFVGASIEAVPTNLLMLELYPAKGLEWITLTCEVM